MLSRLIFTCMLAAGATARAATTDCDRVCLKNALDQYLNAVRKHDPAAAPLGAGFRQTENAVVVRLGTGMWKTLTGLGKLQRRYLDSVSGQAGYFGIVEEGSESAIATPQDHGGRMAHRAQGRSGAERTRSAGPARRQFL